MWMRTPILEDCKRSFLAKCRPQLIRISLQPCARRWHFLNVITAPPTRRSLSIACRTSRAVGFIIPREDFEGRIARGLGDAPRAEAAFLRARERAAASVAARPSDAKALIVLAGIDAKLGRKEEAVREAERAVELLPVARDAVDGPLMLWSLAAVLRRGKGNGSRSRRFGAGRGAACRSQLRRPPTR